jgi:hypothetical protein
MFCSAGLEQTGSAQFVRPSEHPRADFLDVLRAKKWSSLHEIPSIEYTQGLRAIEQEWPQLLASDVRWAEERTVVFGRVP